MLDVFGDYFDAATTTMQALALTIPMNALSRAIEIDLRQVLSETELSARRTGGRYSLLARR